MGVPNGITRAISAESRRPRSSKKSCTRSAASLGAGGALERLARHPDDDRTALESREHIAQGEGAGDAVELGAFLHEPWGGRLVVISAEGHDEDVGLERSRVGHDALSRRVDLAHDGLENANARFHDGAVGVLDRCRRLTPEHHVELREAEDEAVGLVDQEDVDRISERVREKRRQLQPAEARTKDHNTMLHVPSFPSLTTAVHCALSW
jgi:hypothetical protein